MTKYIKELNANTSPSAGDAVEIDDGTNSEYTLIASIGQFHPQSVLINGKLSVTVASNNLTVAIKTLAGANPSSTDPVYVRIGDTFRAITAALSVTKNAGTNWCNAGSAELAAKEVDYFVYLGYNATDGVVIGFSRIPYANRYDDFSTTSTNEKYAAISTITNAAAGDYYENIGRFAATLSAGAGYTWTVPTFTASNLINHPIYETRWLEWLPTYTGFSVSPANVCHRYRVVQNTVHMEISEGGGTSNATTFTLSLPFTVRLVTNLSNAAAFQFMDNSVVSAAPGLFTMDAGQAAANLYPQWGGGNWTAANLKACVRLTPTFYEI